MMRIKENDRVKNKSYGGSILNSGNLNTSEVMSGQSVNQHMKKIVTSVKNSAMENRTSKNMKQ